MGFYRSLKSSCSMINIDRLHAMNPGSEYRVEDRRLLYHSLHHPLSDRQRTNPQYLHPLLNSVVAVEGG